MGRFESLIYEKKSLKKFFLGLRKIFLDQTFEMPEKAY